MAQSYQPATVTKRKGSTFWRVVFWVALLVCIVSAVVLGAIIWSYWNADRQYGEVADKAFPADKAAGMTLADMTVDWEYLRSLNSEVVAWVYMPGTNINYPVCYSGDNEKYLNTDFSTEQNWMTRAGCIFLDENCHPDFSSANNILYGHHMDDGSMFASLSTQLSSSDEFNACRTIYVLTPSKNYECTTFSLVLTNGSDLLAQADFADDADRTKYVQDKIDRSAVQPSTGMPNAADVKSLFTFSTCDYTQSDGRAVLFSQVTDTAVPHSADVKQQGTLIDPNDAAAVTSEIESKEAA